MTYSEKDYYDEYDVAADNDFDVNDVIETWDVAREDSAAAGSDELQK